jgi:glycosyltransferase involved in cell wall biosynthesis
VTTADDLESDVPVKTVGMITGEYPPAMGGIADYTANLVQALRARSLRVRVLTAGSRSPGEDVTDVADWSPRGVAAIARSVLEIEADAVHLQYQTAAFHMSPLVNLLPLLLKAHGVRAPFVTTLHDFRSPYLFPKAGRLRGAANRVLLAASDAAIFVNPSDLARTQRTSTYWIPIAPAIRPEEDRPGARDNARARLGFAPDDVVVAHFGFINRSKGADVLLRAVADLQSSGMRLRLLFVGEPVGASDGTNAATVREMRELADALGVSEQVVSTGPLTAADVSTAFRAADMVALPFVDGASLNRSSLLACWAHGLAVITTYPGMQARSSPGRMLAPFDEPGRFVIDEHVAALVPPGDHRALAAAIHELARDTERRAHLESAGRAFVASLQWPEIAAATHRLYETLGTRSGRPSRKVRA